MLNMGFVEDVEKILTAGVDAAAVQTLLFRCGGKDTDGCRAGLWGECCAQRRAGCWLEALAALAARCHAQAGTLVAMPIRRTTAHAPSRPPT